MGLYASGEDYLEAILVLQQKLHAASDACTTMNENQVQWVRWHDKI